MKFNYKFNNLCGTVYKKGKLQFSPDGNSLLSPVGNKVSCFDLVNNKSFTFPFENRKDIMTMAVSPNGTILITVDEEGRAIMANFQRRNPLSYFNFGDKVYDLQFSPNGKYFAIALGKLVQVWKTPGLHREFAPFVLHRTYGGHYDDVTSINWSQDSRFFVTASKDLTSKLFSLDPIPDFTPVTFATHRERVVGAYFATDSLSIFTIAKDGTVNVWGRKDVPENTPNPTSYEDIKVWALRQRHLFRDHGRVISTQYHHPSKLMVIGFDTGIFGLFEMPEFNMIHSLSISKHKIDTVAINASGEWLAFGCAALGQLLVWEWQSESYVLKQQGHFYDLNSVSYSQDGQLIATGGNDGKVKVWNTFSGFCFVTFTEHTAGIESVAFSKNGQVLFSASKDGTVRAFDLIRYRNFRTFTSPDPLQFQTLAVDPSGEIVCAGSFDSFQICVWSVQTGKLLEILSGHEGPVSGLAYSPTQAGVVVSGSWDKTVKVWDVFAAGRAQETFGQPADVIAVAFRPDGLEIAVACLDGSINFWNLQLGTQTGYIEGKKDIAHGRSADDKITTKSLAAGKYFTSLSYTADGKCILAGSNSKFVCIYEVKEKILLKKFVITGNRSLDGVVDFLNSKNMTEAGPMDLIEDDSDDEDPRDRKKTQKSLPGVGQGQYAKRQTTPMARSKCVQFSPTGRTWSAATTEGLLIYSLDDTITFDPFDLEVDITPDTIRETLSKGEFLKALVMAFRLNEVPLIHQVYESVPFTAVHFLCKDLPVKYLDRLLAFIVTQLEQTPHFEFHLLWVREIFTSHGRFLKDNRTNFLPVFRALHKGVSNHHTDLSKVCDDNQYTLQYLIKLTTAKKLENGVEADDSSRPRSSSSNMVVIEEGGSSDGDDDDWGKNNGWPEEDGMEE